MISRYRAKSIDESNKGEWAYGYLIVDSNNALIVNRIISCEEDYVEFGDWCPVDIDTVGQSTGMFDKNGVEIWEGDIVLTTRLIDYTYKNFKGVVKMLEGCWLIDTGTDAVYLWSEIEENEVVGNIYQNSELLESVDK